MSVYDIEIEINEENDLGFEFLGDKPFLVEVKDKSVTPEKLDREYTTKEEFVEEQMLIQEDFKETDNRINLFGVIALSASEKVNKIAGDEELDIPPAYMDRVPVTEEDNGKILKVVDGVWSAEEDIGGGGSFEIPDGSVTPEKLDREYATPEYVDKKIGEIDISGGLTNENYLEKVEKLPTTPKENELVALVKDEVFDWDNVEYTESLEDVKGVYNIRFSTLPETIDITPIKGKNIASAIVFYNITTNHQIMLTASDEHIQIIFNQSENRLLYADAGHIFEGKVGYEDFTVPENGWYKGDTTYEKATSADLEILNGIYTNVFIVDYGKLTNEGSSIIDYSIDYIVNLLAKEIVLPIEKGFYVAESGQWADFVDTEIDVDKFATKEELNDIYNVLDTLVETVGQKFSGIIGGVTEFDLKEKDFANVTSVRRYAFYQNASLQNVSLPDNIREIGVNAFRDCTGLLTVKISGYTTIQSGAFYGCTNLTDFYLPDVSSADEVPPLANTAAFTNTTCMFNVSSEEVKAFYVSANNWSTFADRFQIKAVPQ